MIFKSRVTILVKASPQPSSAHNETVCCAGIDDRGQWKRLFPIRFRQLSDEQAFKRWNVVEFAYQTPTTDKRTESCKVHEETLKIAGKVALAAEKSSLVKSVLVGSEKAAIAQSASLALIRPTNVKLSWKRRSSSELAKAKLSFEKRAAQTSLFDDELAAYDPCPFQFYLSYDDEGGPHRKECADWETSAAFFNLSVRYDENRALEHLEKAYTQDYVETGLVLALGNMAKRPQTWQLLGLFPVKDSQQSSLF